MFNIVKKEERKKRHVYVRDVPMNKSWAGLKKLIKDQTGREPQIGDEIIVDNVAKTRRKYMIVGPHGSGAQVYVQLANGYEFPALANRDGMLAWDGPVTNYLQ